MPQVLAVIELSFDPMLRLAGLNLPWQTIGVTLALFAALGIAALMAPDLGTEPPFFKRGRPDLRPRFPGAPVISPTGEVSSGLGPRALRLDDMALIVAGAVPGAVAGGRLVHALTYWDAYAAAPASLFDPAVGSLSLTGAVLGGVATALYVADLIGAPIRRWADASAVPLLLAIGLGKMAQLLGGSGQGLPFDGPWALAFTGAGPWISANPALPSHPSQLYEAAWMLGGIPLVLRSVGRRRIPERASRYVAWVDRAGEEGRLFIGALAWFFAGRFLVGFTWRDEGLIGPLSAEQLLALVGLIAALALLQPAARRRLAAALGTNTRG